MSKYLLECEIIGGENSSIGKRLIVRPTRIYPKSVTIGLECEFGILVEEGARPTFNVANPKNFIFAKLDREGFLTLKIKPRSSAWELLNKRCSSAVLELELNKPELEKKSGKDFTVVGFKVQF